MTRLGPYVLHEELGRGGQGTVYRATDTRLGRDVALKVLERGGTIPPETLVRFNREAAAAAKLDHPSICAVYEAGVEQGVPFIAMRLVEGESLAKKIADATGVSSMSSQLSLTDTEAERAPAPSHATAPALPGQGEIRTLVVLAAKAARALHLAHEAGIVHRDIKPGNITVTPAGDPVIMDFGLARDDSSEQTLTRTGDLFGTPAYMSPEQLTRQAIHLDRRTDVWSLGVTLYELVTLRRPFEGPTRERLYQAIIAKEPQDPRRINAAVSKDLAAIIETALQKGLDRRYQTAAAMAADLEACAAGRPVTARRVGPIGRLTRWSRREPAKATLLLFSLIALPTIAVLVTKNLANSEMVESARLLKLQSDKDEALSQGSYELGEGDPDRALVDFQEALGMEGGSPEAVAGIALAHLKRKRPEDALAVLDRHDAVLHRRPAGVVLRAEALRVLGRRDEAAALDRSVPPPSDPVDFYLEGERLIGEGHAGRTAAFTEALNSLAQAIFLSNTPRALYFKSRAHAAGHAGDAEAANEIAAALRQHWPASPIAAFWAGFALFAHDKDAAILAYQDAIRLKPDYAAAHHNLGMALRDRGRVAEAIVAYREAIKNNPGMAEAHYNLAQLLAQKGSTDEAILSYREAIRLRPDHARAHTGLGVSLDRKGLLDEAIAAHREAIRLMPDLAAAHWNLGWALEAKGSLDEGIVAYREAIRLEPEHASPHYGLGNLLRQKGLFDEAITQYREAVRLQPEHAQSHCNLGHALRGAGRIREALDEMHKGHELGSRQKEWRDPSAQWVDELEALARMEERMLSIAEGKATPDGANDVLQLADIASLTHRWDLATRWYADAFKQEPGIAAQASLRAATASVQAAAGAGTESRPRPNERERIRLRGQALEWFQAWLHEARDQAEGGDLDLATFRQTATARLADPLLASVRDQPSLGALPPDEARAWSAFWDEVRKAAK